MPLKNSSSIDYHKMIVTFIDLLGFKNQIQDKMNSADLIYDRLFAFYSLKNIGSCRKYPDPNLKKTTSIAASDCIIRITKIDNKSSPIKEIIQEIEYIAYIQFKMLIQYQLVVRGGMAYDKMFLEHSYNDNIVFFGEAYLRAYEIEQKVANYPRIVVDNSIHEIVGGNDYVKSDADSLHFINYLETVRNGVTPVEDIGTHKECVEILLEKHKDADIKIMDKYRWLARYHDSYIHDMKFNKNQKIHIELLEKPKIT